MDINELDKIAIRIYNARLDTYSWQKIFDKAELIKLWEKCQENWDTVYDDEVYNALDDMNYFSK